MDDYPTPDNFPASDDTTTTDGYPATDSDPTAYPGDDTPSTGGYSASDAYPAQATYPTDDTSSTDGYPASDSTPDAYPGDVTATGDQESIRVSGSPIQRALARRGMLTGVWAERFATAPPELTEFIQRFSSTAGFELVITDLYGYPFQRLVARAATRLAKRMAAGQPDFSQRMSFERDLGVVSGAVTVPLVDLVYSGRRYHFRPWPALEPRTITGQFQRDLALLDDPGSVRWVLDGQRLKMGREAAVQAIRQILSNGAAGDLRSSVKFRQWLEALNTIITLG